MINLDGTWLYVKDNKNYCFTESRTKAKAWKKAESAQLWFTKNESVLKSHIEFKSMMISEL